MTSDDDRTLYVGNLSDKINEELLYELFIQAGPLEYIKLPFDKAAGKPKNFAFICYRHECSVSYATYLLGDTKIFGKFMNIQAKTKKALLSSDKVGVHSLDPEAALQARNIFGNQNSFSNKYGENYPTQMGTSINLNPPLYGLQPPLMQQQFLMAQLNNNLNNRLGWQQVNQMPYNNGSYNTHLPMVSELDRNDQRHDHYSNYRNDSRNRDYYRSSSNSYSDRYDEKDSYGRSHSRSSGSDRYYESSRSGQSYDRSHSERYHERSSSDRYYDRNRNQSRSSHAQDRINYRKN